MVPARRLAHRPLLARHGGRADRGARGALERGRHLGRAALAAGWDPALARRAGTLLAQEARHQGVHVLLAPTVNLHRSPLGGRHFEAYSEGPSLTGRVGAGYVSGLRAGGVGATHGVAPQVLTFSSRVAAAPR